ncbi:MAG: hypothetical protein HYV25_00080 [Candidatus Harrisonbacteria bacterium]|nr:hypothetical protein [Candidatus Harrisonbacteria bacterium]
MGYVMILIAVLSIVLALVCIVLATQDRPGSDRKQALLWISAIVCVVTATGVGWTGVAKVAKNVLNSNTSTAASSEHPK